MEGESGGSRMAAVHRTVVRLESHPDGRRSGRMEGPVAHVHEGDHRLAGTSERKPAGSDGHVELVADPGPEPVRADEAIPLGIVERHGV